MNLIGLACGSGQAVVVYEVIAVKRILQWLISNFFKDSHFKLKYAWIHIFKTYKHL
jgi:hypothetical protein